MNLIVDVGNSAIKLAIFEQKKLLFDISTEHENFLLITRELFDRYPKIQHAIVSSVHAMTEKVVKVLSLFCKVHQLTSLTKTPLLISIKHQNP